MAGRDAWDVVPFESVGPLGLGMSRNEVVGLVGEPKFTRRSNNDSLLGQDQYKTFRAGYDRRALLLYVGCNSSQLVSCQGWTVTMRQGSEVRGVGRRILRAGDLGNSSPRPGQQIGGSG
jgi:hypothetical protein